MGSKYTIQEAVIVLNALSELVEQFDTIEEAEEYVEGIGEDWFWDAVSDNTIITHDFGKFHKDPAWCEIATLEGVMTARAGDYIIRGVNGEIYPCKPDIFEKTYEKCEQNE